MNNLTAPSLVIPQTAVFGGGCFWCTEAIFQMLRGVTKVTPGYAGGDKENPNYYQVSEEKTGHAEVIEIEFDPTIIPYEILLEIFWNLHDPTTLNQQGADTGTQYRSIILTTSSEQQVLAETMKQKLDAAGDFAGPIVTEIKPLKKFYLAEEYHQNYYKNNEYQPYCQVVISPKLQKLRQKYSQLLTDPNQIA